ncbi:MAG: helix-turn-helix domain-containing protein [Chloroflexota bacterium]
MSHSSPTTPARRAKRPYRATVQAEMKALSRQRIIDAVVSLYEEAWLDQITLQQVADRAGVTAKTVTRHFGSKENLLVEVNTEVRARPEMQRGEPEPGDVTAAVACVVDHYEVMGRSLWRLLTQEDRYPALRPMLENGRSFHQSWVQRAFAPQLAAHPELFNPLYALTDLFIWKVLRLERGLSREETETAMRGMVTAVLASSERFTVDSTQ